MQFIYNKGMDYKNIYNNLVQKRRYDPCCGVYEKHHIMPRSLGGKDVKDNMVFLSPREHYVAHLLLAKIHGGPMWAALAYMSRGSTKSASNVRISSRTYDFIKKKDSEWRSIRYSGEGNPFKGKTFTPEQLEKLKGPRPSIIGEGNPCFGKKFPGRGLAIAEIRKHEKYNLKVDTTLRDKIDSMFFERNQELRDLRRSYLRSESMKKSMKLRDYNGSKNPNYGNGDAISGEKNPMWGKKHKQSTKEKISMSSKRRIACPHCGKEGNIGNMKRWHFDNCKQKIT
jgi:hypothetical protein